MFKGSLRDGKVNPFNIGWTGFRVMIVPDGSYENPGPGNDQVSIWSSIWEEVWSALGC